MVSFDDVKFREDLKSIRNKESQDSFAKKLGINRSTLSLLENGRQLPDIGIMSRFYDLSGKRADDYFFESKTDSLVYLMGSLESSDKSKIENMAERIRIREKYEYLAKRGHNAINK